MNEYLKLAWRNIWRNKRRTLITVASIFFAMFFAMIMRSFQIGSYSNMINGAVESFSGHIQIQQEDYFKTPNINNSVPLSDELVKIFESMDKIKFFDPRIQSGLLASSGENSKLGFVIGADPEKTAVLTGVDKKLVTLFISKAGLERLEVQNISKKNMEKLKKMENNYYKDEIDLMYELLLSKKEKEKYLQTIIEAFAFDGKYLTQNDEGVLIGFRLAKFLDIGIGDSIILLGSGYHGETAIGKYPVRGYLKFAGLDFNNTAIYMSLKNAQKLFSAYTISDNMQDTTFLVNYIAINTTEKVNIKGTSDKKILKIKKELEDKINDENISVIFWKKGNIELVQQIESDNMGGMIMVVILYLIIGFGVFGTVLMMVSERKREFGVMIAIGLKKQKLALIVFIEMIFMEFIGLITGFLASAPIITYFHFNPFRLQGEIAKSMEQFNIEPIMPMEFFDTYCINQALVIVIIVFISTIYPVFKITRLKVIKALRS